MVSIRELLAAIEGLAPLRLAASWDASGTQVAGTLAATDKLAVTLDPLSAVVDEALTWGAGLVLSHHPLSLTPRFPNVVDDQHHVLSALMARGAWLYAAHTSLDCAPDGPAAWLADELGLTDRDILEPVGSTPSVMAFYKEVAMDGFAGVDLPAGLEVDRMPFDRDALRHTPQAFVCSEADWPRLRRALADNREVSALAGTARLTEPSRPHGFGLVGRLPESLAWEDFARKLFDLVPRSFWTLCGRTPDRVTTVAYCPGSGGDLARAAFARGADVYVTGDLKHHQALECAPLGLTVDVGHFALEEEMTRRLAADLADRLAPMDVDVRFFAGGDPLRVLCRP